MKAYLKEVGSYLVIIVSFFVPIAIIELIAVKLWFAGYHMAGVVVGVVLLLALPAIQRLSFKLFDWYEG